MKRTVLATALVLSAQAATAATADGLDGNWLNKGADADDHVIANGGNDKDGLESFYFIGYVAGAVDTGDQRFFCTPDSMLYSQANAIVKKYVRQNPNKWHQPARTLVIEALSSAFPCKR